MKIEFDAEKSEKNVRDRGLPFSLVADFDFERAQIAEDDRRDYGEVRYRAVGQIGDVVTVVIFTIREDALRVISLRLAGRKERMKYEKDRHQKENKAPS
jgi:hypothetical protein